MAFELQNKNYSMQKLKNILIKSLLALSIILFSAAVTVAQKLDKVTVQEAINSKHFVFKAQTVLPMSGTSRFLTGDYEVKLSGDSLISYLPYFGRAYSVTYGGSGGIDFTSAKFDYEVRPRKKGGWDITIDTKDVKEYQRFNFTISDNGYASLQVTSNNRQPISFNGYIVEKK
jgi:hypothetical protein